MSKKRYSQEQVVYALKQLEGGAKGREVCRQMGVGEATLYSWKKKYAGMDVGEVRELRQL
jgi:putative transposase